MIVVALFRILFDLAILFIFISMSNPRHDHRNPYCLMMQYSAVPFTARLFPDFVTIGSVSYQQQPIVAITGGSFVKVEPKAMLPLTADDADVTEMLGIDIDFTNATASSFEEFLVVRDSSFKYFLNISILVFMYLGTLLTWAAIRRSHLTGEKVDMPRMRKVFSILMYISICGVWICCNTEFMRTNWTNLITHRYGAAILVNIMAWSFLAVSVRVCLHCIQVIPPRSSTQCHFLMSYLAILNISVWYSFVALYFAYDFYQPSVWSQLELFVPFDENLLVSFLFTLSFMFSPPYRYRFPMPSFFLMRHIGGGLPFLYDHLRRQEKEARRQEAADESVKLEMEPEEKEDTPPAYEAA